MRIVLILLLAAYTIEDDLYILIDGIRLYNCKGVKNEITIAEEDVSVVDEKGDKAYYVHAPGNYSLHFKKVNVEKDLGFLAGEVVMTLQVPIIDGPAGTHFDYPFTIIPETGLLYQRCDAYSGLVEHNRRQYWEHQIVVIMCFILCLSRGESIRYCDLCGAGLDMESELNEGLHQFFPLSPGDTPTNPRNCGRITANEYEFKRTISLPTKETLEKIARRKGESLDDEIKERLRKGRGRLQVYLSLIAADKPSITLQRWLEISAECKCCNSRSEVCGKSAHLKCDLEECKSSWAQQCLHKTARVVSCHSVELNYRMTSSYDDVIQFLREKGYANDDGVILHQSGNRAEKLEVKELPEEYILPLSERCSAAMPKRKIHLRRYCAIYWNAKLCCSHCEGVC